MSSTVVGGRFNWTIAVPVLAFLALIATWGRKPGDAVLAIVAVLLIGAVLAAVHHAEVVAHRVGEPFGSLVLAVAVTIIEVALIVTLMASGGDEADTLARDTVFAAVMITLNGIVGLAFLVAAVRDRFAEFNSEGSGSALATVVTLAVLCLVLPRFTTGASGPEFTSGQLTFAAVASLSLYLMFVFTQTVRHRDFFLPVEDGGTAPDHDDDGHADPPTGRETLASLGLLVVSLVAVVGLAKVESPAIESAVANLGFPHTVVGVVIALLVLLPESIAAVRAAIRRRTQIALNLAYGSAMASIGLTVPTIAIASIWLDGPLSLGLGNTEIVLLLLSVAVGIITLMPGRAKTLNGGLHLAIFAAFLFLSVSP